MFLYNVTVNVQKDVEENWLQWMKDHHIPKVLETGLFKRHKVFKLLLNDDSGGSNYSIQYFVENRELLDKYLEHHAPELRAEHQNKYESKVVAFRTLLQEVS